ncbi:MAG: hypothetical protein QOH00_1278, partial [Gaiellales bacterium]|nr:hypothetical protein [Gaiellales bacterium]
VEDDDLPGPVVLIAVLGGALWSADRSLDGHVRIMPVLRRVSAAVQGCG